MNAANGLSNAHKACLLAFDERCIHVEGSKCDASECDAMQQHKTRITKHQFQVIILAIAKRWRMVSYKERKKEKKDAEYTNVCKTCE